MNPLAADEDYFIELKEPTPAAFAQAQEDIDFLVKALYRALKIPHEQLRHDRPPPRWSARVRSLLRFTRG